MGCAGGVCFGRLSPVPINLLAAQGLKDVGQKGLRFL